MSKAAPKKPRLMKFEVVLHFTQRSRATVVIEAVSPGRAGLKAYEMHADEVDDWSPYDGEVAVLSVTPLKGGKRHD